MKKYFIFLVLIALAFTSCTDKEKAVDLTKYTVKGAEIAKNTQMQLGKNLKGTMKTKGPVAAVAFCNTKAMPLTAEMEQKYDAKIKRVSIKVRNEANLASEAEAQIIVKYIADLKNGKTLAPITRLDGDKVHYYAPIKVGGVCLNCHGTAVAKPIDSILKLKYPNDKALGYAKGDLRGIWSIEMKK
jgi:hypothetical protein